MKKTIVMMMLLGGGLFAAPHFSAGIRFSAPAPVVTEFSACPEPGYTSVDSYYRSDRDRVREYWAPPARVRENVRSYDRDDDFRGRRAHFDRDDDRR